MKFLILGLVLMLALVGCSNEAPQVSYEQMQQQSQPVVGGGCGLSAVDEDAEIRALAVAMTGL